MIERFLQGWQAKFLAGPTALAVEPETPANAWTLCSMEMGIE
jgi:hypothetical protein